VFYHAGLSYLMIRRYADAIETFSDVILHVSHHQTRGSKPAQADSGSQLQKMQDKIMSLTAIAIALARGTDDQVRELIVTSQREAAKGARGMCSGHV
jgi:hypothetical protein